MITVADLAAAQGYRLVTDEHPEHHPHLGGLEHPEGATALVCDAGDGPYIVTRFDSLDWHVIYGVSHEIAEHQHGFDHESAGMWSTQANILAQWCERIADAMRDDEARRLRRYGYSWDRIRGIQQ